VIAETATELITSGFSPATIGLIPFEEMLIGYSLERENRYRVVARNIGKEQKVVILCDRGIPDASAYIDRVLYDEIVARLGCTRNSLLHRYDLVVHLVTAAAGAEEFYTLDNNAARSETPEQARALDGRTQEAWLGHPHHIIVPNTMNFEEKMQYALLSLARRLDMPQPMEIERKFRVEGFDASQIPKDAVAVEITQDYLRGTDGIERRVRKRTLRGEDTFFYTEKMPTTLSGARIETERIITEDEYADLLKSRDPECRTIRKTRHMFAHDGKLFELDVYGGTHSPLVILEVELRDMNEPLELPNFLNCVEVTENSFFANRQLARMTA
jgi:CYTH domain-containing protein/predicted ATPase